MNRTFPQKFAEDIIDRLSPAVFVQSHLMRQGKRIIFDNKSWNSAAGKIHLIAAGKAAAAMCSEVVNIAGKNLIAGGVVTASTSPLPAIRAIPASHPLPDEYSIKAGEAALQTAAACNPNDLLLCLLSGGGSAMMEVPRAHLTAGDLRLCNEVFLKSGMTIEEINGLRAALSRVKNGGLLASCKASTCFTLILSDVPANSPHIVASGPTLRAPETRPTAAIVQKYRLQEELPAHILEVLTNEITVAKNEPVVRHTWKVIADNGSARQAAQAVLKKHGLKATLYQHEIGGEASRQGRQLARLLLQKEPGDAMVAGGETTVFVRGDGKGSRNLELLCGFALEARAALKGKWLAMAFSTDGIDGPTDAAGAWLDQNTWQGSSVQQKEFKEALCRNNTYPVFKKMDTLLHTGPTGTNLRDLFIFVRWF